MKSFKTLVFLAATLSGSLLAACGVDATETSLEAQEVSESALAPACVGTIKCVGPSATSVVTVQCKWSNTTAAVCAAPCPSSTQYLSGSCGVVTTDPPPPRLSANQTFTTPRSIRLFAVSVTASSQGRGFHPSTRIALAPDALRTLPSKGERSLSC